MVNNRGKICKMSIIPIVRRLGNVSYIVKSASTSSDSSVVPSSIRGREAGFHEVAVSVVDRTECTWVCSLSDGLPLVYFWRSPDELRRRLRSSWVSFCSWYSFRRLCSLSKPSMMAQSRPNLWHLVHAVSSGRSCASQRACSNKSVFRSMITCYFPRSSRNMARHRETFIGIDSPSAIKTSVSNLSYLLLPALRACFLRSLCMCLISWRHPRDKGVDLVSYQVRSCTSYPQNGRRQNRCHSSR